MNKNTKLLLGTSSLAVLAVSAFALQGCDNGGDDTAAAAGSGGAAAGSPSVGGAKATAGSGGLAATAGSSSGGVGGVAGVGGVTAGAGGVTGGAGGAAGASGAAGTAGAGGAGTAGAGGAGTAGAGGAGGAGGAAGGSAGSGGAGGAAGSAGAAGTAGAGGATATTFTLQNAGAVGEVLAAANGHTLYVHKGDTASTTAPTSTCTGGCLTAWPAYYGTPVSVPTGVSASDIHSFSNGGTMQSTYMGWPLYTYGGDSAAGTATGNGSGGIWFAVKIPFTPPS